MNSIEKKVVSGTCIVIAAAASALMILLIFSIRTHAPQKSFQAHGGVIDLREWNPLDRTGLSGEWEYFPDQVLLPSDLGGAQEKLRFSKLPGVWNDRREGSATYRLKVLLPEKHDRLAVEICTEATAYALYVNGKLSASAGRVSATRANALPSYLPQIARLDAAGSEAEFVLQVSNYNYRVGGPWRTVWIGDEDTMRRRGMMRSLFFIFLTGAIFTIGAYHLLLHYFRREESQFLYFSAFCFLVGLRTLVSGNYLLTVFIPSVDFTLLIRLEYILFCLCVAAFTMFIRASLPAESTPLMTRISSLTAGAISLFVLVTPVRIFTWSVYALYIYMGIMTLWIFLTLLKGVRGGRPGAAALLAGGLILLAASVNDILYASFIVGIGPLFILGLLFFLLIEGIILSHKFSLACMSAAKMSAELHTLNRDIEGRVEARTVELKEAYNRVRDASVRDGLTGAYNRRYIHEQLPRDIERCVRGGQPLSIIVGDIDFFKNVNDMFGHLAGDRVLVSFCGIIEGSLRKGLEWFGRFGGEEFIIVLPETAPAVAAVIAERIRGRCMGLEIEFEDRKLRFSASFGVSGFDRASFSDNVNAEELFRMADNALYAAKRAGRNRVESCSLADCGAGAVNAGR